MLSKDVEKRLEDIISFIMDSLEYKKCIELKEKMKDNEKINSLINEIKKMQKKYINEEDCSIKELLNIKEQELNEIPIYNEYNNNLKVVNKMITMVKDELNEYFYNKLNQKIGL